MTEPRTERRLAAILAADVAGYSRLTGSDEEGTLARLKALRHELIDPAIANARGRVIKTMGDGILIEFQSAVDAVRCAIEVQRGMTHRNAGLVQDQRIEFRVGIHVGDVVVDGDDLLGDGVNIAARLEGIAETGGITLSEEAYRHVTGKVAASFVDLGEQNLKNIARPVRVYRVELGEGSAEQPNAPTLALPDKPSIAVLPFQNMSGDAEQDYFCDGMVEDIITGLSRIRWLFVIARNSSFTYKGKAVDVKQVGRELGVRYVLEGSVRKAANRVRITGQLIDATTGAHLWADRYDRPLDDIFAVQDEITLSVVGAIEPSLRLAEIERVKRKRPENLGAPQKADGAGRQPARRRSAKSRLQRWELCA
jgi:adenylate cyclase